MNKTAPDGQIYVCGACGKTSKTRTGWSSDDELFVGQHGWDASCFLNAVLCYETKIDDVWVAVRDGNEKREK